MLSLLKSHPRNHHPLQFKLLESYFLSCEIKLTRSRVMDIKRPFQKVQLELKSSFIYFDAYRYFWKSHHHLFIKYTPKYLISINLKQSCLYLVCQLYPSTITYYYPLYRYLFLLLQLPLRQLTQAILNLCESEIHFKTKFEGAELVPANCLYPHQQSLPLQLSES